MFVNAETDFVEERFAPGSTLWLAPGRGRRSLTVASLRVQGGRPVLSFEGLTSPNIFAVEHEFHSRLEWVSVQDMEKSVQTIVHLAMIFEERA